MCRGFFEVKQDGMQFGRIQFLAYFGGLSMKHCSLVICSLVLGLMTVQAQDKTQKPSSAEATKAQSSASSPSTTPSKIDPAKEADIRRLLDLSGAKALATQTMDTMSQSIKPLLARSLPPGDYREKLIDLFFEKFRSKASPEQLMDMAVPAYDKYFTHDEIKGLIKFYETPLGQKTLSVLPKLMGELQQNGEKWGGDLGEQSMAEVLSEHPELAEALETARKAQHQ
jgi:hypothetical protein